MCHVLKRTSQTITLTLTLETMVMMLRVRLAKKEQFLENDTYCLIEKMWPS